MSNEKNNTVSRRIKCAMQSYGKLGNSEIRGEVTAVFLGHVDNVIADLTAKNIYISV